MKAVLAESFERIHRSNLIGMGVLPLEFRPGESAEAHGLDGTETLRRHGHRRGPRARRHGDRHGDEGRRRRRSTFDAKVRIDTQGELEYYRHGGILQYVLRQLT